MAETNRAEGHNQNAGKDPERRPVLGPQHDDQELNGFDLQHSEERRGMEMKLSEKFSVADDNRWGTGPYVSPERMLEELDQVGTGGMTRISLSGEAEIRKINVSGVDVELHMSTYVAAGERPYVWMDVITRQGEETRRLQGVRFSWNNFRTMEEQPEMRELARRITGTG